MTAALGGTAGVNPHTTSKSRRDLAWKRHGRAIGFDLMSIGEVQFLRSVLLRFTERFPNDLIWMFHHENTTAAEFENLVPALNGRVRHVPYRRVREPWFEKLDLYVTTEQFVPGPIGVYTLTLFHGQPVKGVTFLLPNGASRPHDALEANDALFLYGPLHRETLREHLAIRSLQLPSHLSLFDIGYTKSDDLLNGRFTRENYLRALGLDPAKKTILYAPAFNEGASLREAGVAILEALCAIPGHNVLAKLPIDCLRPTSDIYATGGVDWFQTIGRLERSYPDFRLVRDLQADPAMAGSDVMVTCISSIGFEFLALGRPVIYIDTPRYFENVLPHMYPEVDTTSWKSRTSVNGGRQFGLVVSCPDELPKAVAEVLAHPETYPRDKAALRDYLVYNPGNATEIAVEQMDQLLRDRVRSQRPRQQAQVLLDGMTGYSPMRVRIARRVRSVVLSKPKRLANDLLYRYGYTITKTGIDYFGAKNTVAAARARGLSVCQYCESIAEDPRKRGRRDRIIARLTAAGAFANASRVCEIGAGTGIYLEKVIDLAHPGIYEVYETDRGWVHFLMSEYGRRTETRLICHTADGSTLSSTPDSSTDLVHAHGVFTCLPLLHTLHYLKECVRICRPGGQIAFDCYLDSTFSSLSVAENWLAGPYRSPVVIPKQLLQEFAASNNLFNVASFSEIHGSGAVDYLVWQMASS